VKYQKPYYINNINSLSDYFDANLRIQVLDTGERLAKLKTVKYPTD